MATFPLIEAGQRVENAGAQTSTSKGATVTANAAANTKGTYTQLIASCAFDVTSILIMLDDQTAALDYLVDIAVGAAAAEVIIASNLLGTGGTGSISYGAHYFFPVNIPAGSRISARCQCSTGGSLIQVSALLFGGGFLDPETLGDVETFGADTTDSGGVNIDPGATVNTKGAYSQLSAATPYPIRLLTFSIGCQLNTVRTTQSWLVDIAVGAAGSEVVILPNIVLNCSTSPDIIEPQTINRLPVNIPAGTRLSVRAQSSGNDATDRLFDIILYGVS